jgi:hypothetical protein
MSRSVRRRQQRLPPRGRERFSSNHWSEEIRQVSAATHTGLEKIDLCIGDMYAG